ncbi:AbrB family transcriptional regulator [Candidatus Uhrbacteria bacterium CG22_combo_CG10-13_8_21_14_all_47_17]|uniref:AbrB family transcriptional regulator n=1 Tax=Candidatus Uhrbacteria bacterium CG22_combo_CG10-13_8_21_14_all_47_17 TaxID=1975041 RepID=A0A2H0BRR1_9BACT|nr:MAG: AbrB family transcriptional regulator [Candidatus Uhrbacteria bacterium CG22_combo_CG10-13_8_21_14_all_47_17]
MSVQKKSTKKKDGAAPCEIAMGASVIGERGQIVIPKQIRSKMQLKPGSRLMIMEHESGAIVLLPVDHMKMMIKTISKKLDRM